MTVKISLRSTFIILLIVISFFKSNSQELTGKWALFYATDLLNNPIESDLTFHELNFLNNEKVEVFPKIVVQGINKYECVYEMIKDSIIIEFSYFKFKYKIKSLSSDSLVLTNLARNYYFRKYINHEEINHQTDKLILTKERTQSFIRPMYNRDLYKYLSKNMTFTKNDKPSYNVEIEFILRKTKNIDSIIINADTLIRDELYAKVIETNRKWTPAKTYDGKIDRKIKFKILVASKEIKSVRTKNPKSLCYSLFDKGYEFYISNDIDSAYYFFSECITFHEFYESLSQYDMLRYNTHNCWVNAVMNKAVILYKAGLKDDACINWSKIIEYDEEAYNLYKDNCLDIE